MSVAIAGHQDTAVRGEIEICSAPIGGQASSPFDDRNHRAEIVWLQARFKDEVQEHACRLLSGCDFGCEHPKHFDLFAAAQWKLLDMSTYEPCACLGIAPSRSRAAARGSGLFLWFLSNSVV